MLTNNQIQIFCNTNTNKTNNVNSINTNTNSNQATSSGSTCSQSSFSIVPSGSSSNSNSTSSSSSTSSLNSVRVAANSKAQMVNNQYVTSAKQANQNPTNSAMSNPVQVQNYITWINSHLKKRPGVRLVDNLQTDLASGVSLVHLIEVISGTVLTDVNLNPKTQADFRDNIEKILKFMQSNSIKMHQTTSKEIIEGNVKSIMRLVLALAAHYKPNNVQPYSTSVAASAAAASSKMSTNNMQASSVTSASTNNLHQYNQHNHVANYNNHHMASGQAISTVNSKSPFANTSTTPPSNKQTFLVNKRSQSTNNVHMNNNTYLILNENHKKQAPNQHQQYAVEQQAPISTQSSQFVKMSTLNNNQDKGRNLDSMTHLVQAACVSLADVRRYKNENFNIKYVKRNNLQSPSSLKSTASSNYLNPINLNNNNNNNQTYTLNNNVNNNNRTVDLSPKAPNGLASNQNNQTTISVTSLMSPNFTQPIASSTVLQLNYPINSTLISPVVASTSNVNKNSVANQQVINTKKLTPKNITYVLNKEKNELAEEIQTNELTQSSNKISNTSNENKSTNLTYTSSNMNTNPESNTSDQKDTKTLTANSSSSTDSQQENVKSDKTSETRKLDLSMPDISELDLEDVQGVKHLLLNLQTLLMNGNLDEFKLCEIIEEQMCRKLDSSGQNLNDSANEKGAEMNTSPVNRSCNESNDSQDSENHGSFALANLTPEEQICILRSKIQQLEILNADMRNELNAVKCETVNKNGIQSGLKTRISEQNNTILEMKNEQINLQLANEKLTKERDELNQQLNQYLVQMNNLKNEILIKDTVIDKLKTDINELRKEREQVKLVKQQVKQVSDTLDIVQEKENVLSNMITNTDRKLEIIDNKLNHNHHLSHHHMHDTKHPQKEFVLLANVNKTSLVNHDELTNLKESIEKLRHNQNQSQTNQLLINQIEQSLTNIIEKFSLSATNPASCSKNQITANLISSSTTSTTSSSSSSSGSSSLTSSSANSPVLALAQPTGPQSPSSSSSIHSTSSSSSSISANSLVVTAPSVQHQVPIGSSQQLANNEPGLINSESNVKKIISRLLSQNYLMNAANTNPHQFNYQQTQAHYQSQNLKPNNENSLGGSKFSLKYTSNTLPRKEISSNNGSTTNLSNSGNNNNALLTISSASNLQSNSCYSTDNLHPNSISISCSNNSNLSSTNSSTNNNNNNNNQSSVSVLSSSSNTPSHFTKCIYYLDKNATPFMTTIYKNIGSVTLNDFKESVQLKSGNYRFRFKSQDPEFGPIKEEISIDNKPLPLFEGRIVAWIENF